MTMVNELEKEADNNNNDDEAMMLNNNIVYDKVKGVVGGSAVVVFSSKDCCMSHVAKRLLFSLGVGPTIVELDTNDKGSAEIKDVLYQLTAQQKALPAIFVGGKFLGGIESLMASHINGSLVPLLKQAGALWL